MARPIRRRRSIGCGPSGPWSGWHGGVGPFGGGPDLIEIGEQTGLPLDRVAALYFGVGTALSLDWIREQVEVLGHGHVGAAGSAASGGPSVGASGAASGDLVQRHMSSSCSVQVSSSTPPSCEIYQMLRSRL